MIQKIIGLDESGIFEGSNDNLRLIGGFVKDCADPEKEMAALEAFFRSTLASINAEFHWGEEDYHLVYPYSLHTSADNIFAKVCEDGTLEEMRKNKQTHETFAKHRKAVSARLQAATLQFLKEKEYRIYALVDSGEDWAAGSNVVDFDVAGNRYERLAILALYNTIFYSLQRSAAEKACLHLATRSLYVRPGESETAEAAEQLYAWKGENREGARYFENTTLSTFKTALADKYYESGHLLGKMDFSFHVNCADYKLTTGAGQPFLYLADIVCGYLRQTFLHMAPIEAKEAVEVPLDIWVYGAVDRKWRRALERYREGRLNECFALLYELKKGSSAVHDYYRKVWAETLEKQVLTEVEASGEEGKTKRRELFGMMPLFLAEIEQDMLQDRRDRGFYLADRMRDILGRILAREPQYAAVGKRYLFQVHDLILRGLNYRGAVDGLVEHIAECNRYRSAAQVEDYLYHAIRVLQYFFNSYQFERAAEVAAHLSGTVEKLLEAYQACAQAGTAIAGEILECADRRRGQEPMHCVAAGRLYSTMGQAFAFLGKYGQAKKHFAKAAQAFGDEDNSRITLVHEMQLYIDQKKKAEYERTAQIYYGTGNLWEQWRQTAEGLPRSCYALQAFVKAFRVFYAADASNDYVAEDIMRELIGGGAWNGHPWQIIYQNLYRIAQETGVGRGKADWLREQMLTCAADEPCIAVMQAYYRVLAAQLEQGDTAKAAEHFVQVVDGCGLRESFPELAHLASGETRKLCRYLAKKIRYEYV